MFSDSRINEIARVRLRVGAILVMRECLRLFFAWIMIWAVAVVGLRAVLQVDRSALWWGVLGLAVAVAAGAVLAIRKLPSATVIRALLDRHGRLGGLLMAAADTDIGPWRQQIARVPMPAIRWRSRRQWMLLSAAVAFLIAAFLAPDRYLPSGGETVLHVGGEMQKLTEKIKVLKEEQILAAEKAQALERDLDHVRQEALGKDPAKTMEAIDHLEQSLSKAAADGAESAIKQTEAASQAQELAAALPAAEGQMDPKQFREAMKDLAHMAQEAAAESQSLSDKLSDDLRKALQQGTLTDEQLRELRKSLKECKACERAKLVKLIEARLVDGAELAECDKAGECDEATLVDLLSQCKDGKQLAAALALCDPRLAGRGGPGGGGPAAITTWSKGANKEGIAFKEKVLRPAAVASLKKSRTAGISVGDPTSAKPVGGSVGGALDSAQAGGGEARSQIILPEHEKTVQRYFNREKK